jgi:hypothetical protein
MRDGSLAKQVTLGIMEDNSKRKAHNATLDARYHRIIDVELLKL